MTTSNQHVLNLVAFLQSGAPQISVHRHPHELQDTADWWEHFARHVQDLAHSVASDASEHVQSIKPKLLDDFVTTAFEESDVAAELRNEAYDLIESAREAAE